MQGRLVLPCMIHDDIEVYVCCAVCAQKGKEATESFNYAMMRLPWRTKQQQRRTGSTQAQRHMCMYGHSMRDLIVPASVLSLIAGPGPDRHLHEAI
jgi:hypothetical protein